MVVAWVAAIFAVLPGGAAALPVTFDEQDDRSAGSAVVSAVNRGGCGGCHTIPGIPGADGTVGPDLSQLGSVADSRRDGYSAREYIRESIVDPDAFIAPDGTEEEFPAGVMLKSFGESLSQEDLQTVVDYLASLGTPSDSQRSAQQRVTSLERGLGAESVSDPYAALPGAPADDDRASLGRSLFFDRRLSANNSLSCASCHQPKRAFADGRAVSRGYPSTHLFRNTPSLLNTARQTTWFRDGRLGDLPSVVRDHLTEAHFMASDGRLIVERMRQIPAYVDRFQEVYGDEPGFGRILDAISAYVRTLNSPRGPYDRFVTGESDALSADAERGLQLFRGRAGCVRCHPEPHFSDQAFHRLDVPSPPDLLGDSVKLATFRRFFRVLGTPNSRHLERDPGRGAIRLSRDADGAFRTPSLREVARTAPYMHNGSLSTLKEVVEFYNRGGGAEQTAGLQPLHLSDGDVRQLVAFLKTLSSAPDPSPAPRLPDYAVLPTRPGPKPNAEEARSEEAAGSAAGTAAPQQQDEDAFRSEAFPPLASLPSVPVPDDNPITADRVELGRHLFFDPRMSGDGSTSCHSCHAVRTGGTIRTAISMGGPGTSHWRNSQTVLNVAFYGKLNWDGAKSSIESQNAGAWTGAVAGNLDPALAEERLARIPEYVRRFRRIFGTTRPRWEDALRAVAAFQRTLVSRETPFDRWLDGDDDAISASARRGHALFRGTARCIACHNGPLASDDDYHALGVPQHPSFFSSPLKQITFRYELVSKGVPETVYRTAREDDGLYYVTRRESDRGKFRTPGLRGLVHTGPYMHNGVFGTLEEVVAFYNRGGGRHPNRSNRIRPLGLSDDDQQDLVAFLRTLSGPPLQVERPDLFEWESPPATSDPTEGPSR